MSSMSGAAKAASVLLFILLLVWLVLLTLANLGVLEGTTHKYVKDRKWDKMRDYLKKLYAADGTEDDDTICEKIREYWDVKQDEYNDFISGQEDGDPATLKDWTSGFPVEITFEDFMDKYFEDLGEQDAENNFLDIAEGVAECEDEVDLTKLKENVVNIIKTTQPVGYDPTDDCSNVAAEQSVLPNYVWSYDDDVFLDISTFQDTEISSTGWRNKHKRVCNPLAMDEEFIPAQVTATTAGPLYVKPKIKFTNVTNAIKDMVIKVAEKRDSISTVTNDTGLVHTIKADNVTNFEIPIPEGVLFDKPLYYIKLDGKDTDHIFAGNIGSIEWRVTKPAEAGTPAVIDPVSGLVTTAAIQAKPAVLDYRFIEFKSNIDIPIGYEIIIEATKFPAPQNTTELFPHSCNTSVTAPKIVAKKQASTVKIDKSKTTTDTTTTPATTTTTTTTIPQLWCYGTKYTDAITKGTEPANYTTTTWDDSGKPNGLEKEYIADTYTAYIRKIKSPTLLATAPENPQYKFATLVRAAAATTGST